MSQHTTKDTRGSGYPTFGLPGPVPTGAATGRSGVGHSSTNQVALLDDAGTTVLQVAANAVGIPAGVWVNSGAADLAATGSVIANAAAVVSQVVNVTAGNDTKGIILPSVAPVGTTIFAHFTGASAGNGTKVYPPVNGTINGGSANAAVVAEDKSAALFTRVNSTNWAAIFTANS